MKNLLLLLTSLNLITTPAFAQDSMQLIQDAYQQATAGNEDEAIRLANLALEKDADNLSIHNFRASIFVVLEKYAEAIEAIDTAKPLFLARLEGGRKMTMLDDNFFKHMSTYYLALERFEEALSVIIENKEVFAKYDPDNARIQIELDIQKANVYTYLESFEDAIAAYGALMQLHETDSILWEKDIDTVTQGLAVSYFMTDQFPESLKWQLDYLKILLDRHGDNNPLVADQRRNVARTYYAMNEFDNALAHLDTQLDSYLNFYEELPENTKTGPSGFEYENDDWMDLSRDQRQELFAKAVIKVFDGPDKVKNKNNLMIAAFQEYLGDAQQRLGKGLDARFNYQKAQKEYTEILGGEHPRLSAIEMKLADSRASDLSINGAEETESQEQEGLLKIPTFEGLNLQNNDEEDGGINIIKPPSN